MSLAGTCVVHPDFGGTHLCIFVTDYANYRDSEIEAVIVNITSWHQRKDQTLILMPGDHDFITRKSVVAYRSACLLKEWQVNHVLLSGKEQPPASRNLLLKIGNGLLKSPFTPEDVKQFYFQYSRDNNGPV
jgi:hypothetical protein